MVHSPSLIAFVPTNLGRSAPIPMSRRHSTAFASASLVAQDGPTAIIFGGSGQGKLHVACSALHFEPVDDVEWRMVFHEKRREDVTVELILT